MNKYIFSVSNQIIPSENKEKRKTFTSEFVRFEKELYESNERFKQVADNIGVAFYLYDIETNKIVYANKAYEEYFSNFEDVYKNPDAFSDIVHWEDKEELLKDVENQRLGIKPLDREFRVFSKDNKIKYMHVNGFFVKDNDGKVIRTGGVVQDITAQKIAEQRLEIALEEAKESNRLKINFLATVSHELRSPLNTIIGFSDVLIQQILGDLNLKQKDAVEIISRAGDHLLALINEILDYSRLEFKEFRLNEEKVDLQYLVAEVCNQFYVAAATKKINLEFEYDSLLNLRYVYIDPLRIKQILINIINNAIKFTEFGGVKVYLKISSDNFEIRVKDTGVGISEEYLPNIFKEFSQFDTSYSRKFEGTGLGLSIVKKIVDKMNADITVTSEINKGTCFKIIFPIKAIKE